MDANTVVMIYSQLNKGNLALLNELYHPDVIFEDPAHRIVGRARLTHYFESLYQQVIQCQFQFDKIIEQNESAFLTWKMHLTHPKLNRGQLIVVSGASYIEFVDNAVIYHRDYFDLGEMLYEQIPLLGSLINLIKRNLTK
jgi:hypothetical protein